MITDFACDLDRFLPQRSRAGEVVLHPSSKALCHANHADVLSRPDFAEYRHRFLRQCFAVLAVAAPRRRRAQREEDFADGDAIAELAKDCQRFFVARCGDAVIGLPIRQSSQCFESACPCSDRRARTGEELDKPATPFVWSADRVPVTPRAARNGQTELTLVRR